MIYALGLSIFMITTYILFETQTKKPLFAMMIKALASLSFIGVFGISLGKINDPMVMLWFSLGLVSGLVGDLVLALRPLRPKEEDKTIIIFGIISFSLGHLFYLIGIAQLVQFSIYALLIGLVALVVIFFGSKILSFDMGIARYPSLFYAFLIFTFVGQTIIFANQHGYQLFHVILMSGAVLFAISDLILSPIYFKGETRNRFIALNLVTYYAAQVLIAYAFWYF